MSATGVSNPETEARLLELIEPVTSAAQEFAQKGMSRGREYSVLLRAVDRISAQLRQVLDEQQGMTNELLRMYEYVGIVFDLTPQLLGLRQESEVTAMLSDSLRTMFPETQFAVARIQSDGPGDGVDSGQMVDAPRMVDAAPSVDAGLTVDGVHVVEPARAVDVSGEVVVTGDYDDLDERSRGAFAEAVRDRKVLVVSADSEGNHPRDGRPLGHDQVMIVPVFAGDSFVCALMMKRPSGAAGWESGDMRLLDSLATFCGDVIRNFRLVHQLQCASMETVRTLVNAVDQKDPYTSGHSNRVGYYACLLGRELGFDEKALQVLEWSALLHDVGKIGIRDDVLKKPGKLTDEEFEHIKEHPVRSFDVVKRVPQLAEALDGIRHHHERWDGKGYPDGLKGTGIPLQARLIQVADIFDALTSSRSYRKAFGWPKALSIIEEEAGTAIDPTLATMFCTMIREDFSGNDDAWEKMTLYGKMDDVEPADAPRITGDRETPEAGNAVE